jgi:hypothetical protein
MEHRLDGLNDDPRSGAPRQTGDDAVEAVIVKTLEETPKDATNRSTRSMAQATAPSRHSSVDQGTGVSHHRVGGQLERRTEAVRLA